MPGQEHGDNWPNAWEHVVKARNFRVRHEHEAEHFHVAPLLHSTTGLSMQRLCFLVKQKYDSQQQQQQQPPPQGVAPSEEGTGEMVADAEEASGRRRCPGQVQLVSGVCFRCPGLGATTETIEINS